MTQEKFVLDLVDAYLAHRSALEPLPEEDPKNNWDRYLTDEEKKNRTEEEKKRKEEENKEKE